MSHWRWGNPDWGFPLWSLHVLSVLVCVCVFCFFPRYSDWILLSKNMYIRLTGSLNFTKAWACMTVCVVCLCVDELVTCLWCNQWQDRLQNLCNRINKWKDFSPQHTCNCVDSIFCFNLKKEKKRKPLFCVTSLSGVNAMSILHCMVRLGFLEIITTNFLSEIGMLNEITSSHHLI